MEQNLNQPPQTQFVKPTVQTEPVKPMLNKISSKADFRKNLEMIIACVLVVLAGVATAWLLSGKLKSSTSGSTAQTVPGAKQTQKEAGITDEATFKDSAEGTLEQGGISGEGTHHLTREGGASQNVYLTSSVIDLEGFVGKKVQVWGETISAKAGWLMDVGKIKVIE
jgi:hypothetical protein